MCEEAIVAALMVENKVRCQPPLEEREVLQIARSVSRYVPAPEDPPASKTAIDF